MKQMTKDAVEESLRIQLADSRNTITSLTKEIATLQRTVREEQLGRYEAYKRIAELVSEKESN